MWSTLLIFGLGVVGIGLACHHFRHNEAANERSGEITCPQCHAAGEVRVHLKELGLVWTVVAGGSPERSPRVLTCGACDHKWDVG